MDPMTAFLMSMQAAGLVTSIFGAHSQQKYIEMGRQLENQQFQNNLQAIKLQSAEGSLSEMKQLRSNIGSQIANQAALGNRGGSSYSGINKSVNAFNNDERTRRMNLLAQESELRANNVLSGLHTSQSESQLGQQLTKSIFDTLPISSIFNRNKKKSPNTGNSETFSWGF